MSLTSIPILEVVHLSKTYQSASSPLQVLQDISFSIQPGETVSIVGPSGSGKTTLLGLCAGLDRATHGYVALNGTRLQDQSEDALARIRNENIGFVFQNFQLLPTLTAIENVMVPMELKKEKNIRSRALELLDQVGLADRSHHYPSQLSGGEQQRVSIARAFANQPKILFADEPTGNLDAETSEKIEALLFNLNKAAATTLIMVTHDLELAGRTNRIIKLKGGKLIADEIKKDREELVP
ncbi:ABC transporter ATP-binding protein [Flavihumibacter sp. UBA7668]|uniref:ABC transporter ATP-binding protein n=1 Tax=Flavihumibacter sp. UBA7668 TaxID=1946542 RepID=UPI0025C62F3B|nr:ABC transporter ATP-binding protein [Flavihumibacter sp. UBA7668]